MQMDPNKKVLIICVIGFIFSGCVFCCLLFSAIIGASGSFGAVFYLVTFVICYKKLYTAIRPFIFFTYFVIVIYFIYFIVLLISGIFIDDIDVSINDKRISGNGARLQLFVTAAISFATFCYTILLLKFLKKDHEYLKEICFLAPKALNGDVNDGPIIISRNIVPNSFFDDPTLASTVPPLNDWRHPGNFHIDVNIHKFVDTSKLASGIGGRVKGMIF